MDILTHTLSGIAIGTMVVNFSKNGYAEKMAILFFSGIGAAFPDIDAISLWSKFDNTFGSFFGLNHTGHEIYFSKFWYSHHAFFHSLFAGILFAFVSITGLYLFRLLFRKGIPFIQFLNIYWLVALSFILGYIMHMLGDMPTPSAVWGGVNFFWPSHSYIGGSGKIWWWNNYDIFLIIMGCIILNTVLYISALFVKFNKKVPSLCIGLCCFVLIFVQIYCRPVNFNYTEHTNRLATYEELSKQAQQNILGKKLYKVMVKFDNKLPINF